MDDITHNRYIVADATNATPSARCVLPRVRLRVDRDSVMASVPGFADAPFPLPRVPATLLQHILALTIDFAREHWQCLAMLLLLDLRRSTWDFIIPHQVASVDGARWCLDGPELAAVPQGYALAGTFQMYPGHETVDLMQGVPPIDGVHFVEPAEPVKPVGHVDCTFICAGGGVTAVPLQCVVVDDFERDQATLAERVVLV